VQCASKERDILRNYTTAANEKFDELAALYKNACDFLLSLTEKWKAEELALQEEK
jgi:peptidoglycan hydrolase CwlO-like protein